MIRYLNDLEAREPEVIEAVKGAFFRQDPATVSAELVQALKDPGMRVIAACLNNQVVGVAVFSLTHQAEIKRIGVYPRFRNRGLGREMVEWAASQWKKPLVAQTDDEAAGFYRKLGFTVVEAGAPGLAGSGLTGGGALGGLTASRGRWNCTRN